jgi:hypothetical protein
MVLNPRGPALATTLLASGVALLATGAGPAAAQAPPDRLPVFEVVRSGATAAQAARLADALGLDAQLREADGSLSFQDPDRFGFLPTRSLPKPAAPDEEGTDVIAQAPDLEAIKRIEVLSDDRARTRAAQALREAGLAFKGTGKVTNSMFESRDAAGKLEVPVDTHVSFPARLAGRRLIGAGSKSKIVFDGDGRVTFLRYAARELREGAMVELIDGAQADQLAEERYRNACAGQEPLERLSLDRELVYLAPDLAENGVKKIVPHYAYSGTARVAGQTVTLQKILLPATRDGAPQAKLELSAAGSRIRATTTVEGGTGPYAFGYSSCATQLPESAAEAGPTLDYTVRARRGGGGPAPERLTVTVTDANGLTSTAVAQADVVARAARRAGRARMATAGVVDVSSEGVGVSQGLTNTEDNTRKFRNEMDDVADIPFFFMEYDVWESDFTDASAGGDDDRYADNVDLMWFQGHGSPNGFTTGDDGWVDRSEVEWGDQDLEWLVVHSCDVLDISSSGGSVWDRWEPAFDGLHLLLGYGNSSYNVDGDGNDFGDSLADDEQKLRDAWVEANEDHQLDGVIYRYMGVYGASGEWNREDYFHGEGSVSADIRTITGSWSYSGTV